ncbi:hypothetical protein BC830DRAFT_1102242 [Chytriomyces sp. MP71]|nr:hypothetical protein BC830DRAFT_1102242 [Chytriomyces sp. MP71]
MNRKSEVIGVSFCIGRDQTKITVYEWRTMSNATDTLAANLHRVGFMLVSDAHVLTSKMGASVNYSTSDDGKEVPFIITFQFYFELVLAIYSLFMAGFTLNFIIRRDLPARGLDRSLKNVFSPATSLLIPSFLGLASFFVCSALYYSHIFPEAGFAQFFAIGIIHGSDCWYSWLRSGQVVRLHYSPKAVRFLQVELCAIPFLFLAPAIIQFAPIGLAKSIKYASIAMSVAIIVVVNLDLNYLNVFLR